MTHSIKTIEGKYIYGKEETEAVYRLIYNGLDHVDFKDKRLSVYSDKRTDKDRETIIRIELLV